MQGGMAADAVGPDKRPRLFCLTSPLEQKPSVAVEEKERNPPMERRRSAVYEGFRHRAEYVVLLVHEHDLFFRGLGGHSRCIYAAYAPESPGTFFFKEATRAERSSFTTMWSKRSLRSPKNARSFSAFLSRSRICSSDSLPRVRRRWSSWLSRARLLLPGGRSPNERTARRP